MTSKNIVLINTRVIISHLSVSEHSRFDNVPVILTRNKYGENTVHAYIGGGEGNDNPIGVAKSLIDEFCKQFPEFRTAEWSAWYTK